MSIEELLGNLIESPYSKFLVWVLTISGGIFPVLQELKNKKSSDRKNLLDNETNARLYFSKKLVAKEIAIWKGFHSSYPLLTRYASVISDQVNEHSAKDLSPLSQLISDALRHEETKKEQGFDGAVGDLIRNSYNPLLESAKMQFEDSEDTENVQNAEKLISKEFEDPVTWIRAEEKVLSGLREWTPKCETPKGMQDLEKYLKIRRNALDKCIKFGTRLLLARKFYDVASLSPKTDDFARYRSDLWKIVGQGLIKQEGDFVVTLSNNVIMEVLDILLRDDS